MSVEHYEDVDFPQRLTMDVFSVGRMGTATKVKDTVRLEVRNDADGGNELLIDIGESDVVRLRDQLTAWLEARR